MQNWASSATTRRSHDSASWKPAPIGVALHRRDRHEPRVAQEREARWYSSIVADISSSRQGQQADHRLPPSRVARVEHRRVEPGGEARPGARTTTTRTSSGIARADRSERAPHGRRLGVAHLGPVEGDRGDGAVDGVAQTGGGQLVRGHARSVGTPTDTRPHHLDFKRT